LVRLESHTEHKVCQWADAAKIEHLKLNVQGKRGFPDRIFFIPGGHPLLIEFKRAGEKTRALQDYRHAKLRAAGYRVVVADNIAVGIAALEAARLSDAVNKAPVRSRKRGVISAARLG
jgi:hypothetical protein